MQQTLELPREGLGLPPLALQAVLQHLSSAALKSLLRSSCSVRHEILMSSASLRFVSSASPGGSRAGGQLHKALQQRKEPLKLTLETHKEMNALLAAASKPAAGANGAPDIHNGIPMRCVEELVLEVRPGTHAPLGMCIQSLLFGMCLACACTIRRAWIPLKKVHACQAVHRACTMHYATWNMSCLPACLFDPPGQ